MEISRHAWETAEAEIFNTGHGAVTLVIQDGRLVQLEKSEKIRITPDFRGKATQRPPEGPPRSKLRAGITQALAGLRFGQVVVVVRDHKIAQIERVEKQRVDDLEGLFGEGI